MEIARLIGGAGTGKTSELLRLMARVIERGIEPREIGFVSFTRAARREAAERASEQFGCTVKELEQYGWFRTLHSVCYRCLEIKSKELLSGDKESLEWLTDAIGEKASFVEGDGDREAKLGSTADLALFIWHAARARLEPLEAAYERMSRANSELPPLGYCRTIAERFELAKRLDGRCDFSDLLSRFAGLRFGADLSLAETEPEGFVPGLPVWFFDEQQDTSPLLDRVCRRLIGSPKVKWVYVAGDPFQSIYGWAGSDAACFMAWDAEHEKIMKKSWRCGGEILSLGEKCIEKSSDYFDREIAPADRAASVQRLGSLEAALTEVDPESDWLLIARTNWEARRWQRLLSEREYPWTATKGNGAWLARSKVDAMHGLLCLSSGMTADAHEVKRIFESIPSKCSKGELLKRGSKTKAKKREQWPDEIPLGLFGSYGATPLLLSMIQSGEWTTLIERGAEFMRVINRHGPLVALDPRIKVGTIHSVKGAEAESVAINLGASYPIARARDLCPDARDEERRVAYVGVTRAKSRLVLASNPHCRFQMKPGD